MSAPHPFRRRILQGLGALGALVAAPVARAQAVRVSAAAPGSAHDFTFESIDGGPMPLAAYAGRPLLVVNTASKCGFTYQYDGLQTLWERYRDEGFTLLAVPSGDFNQEYASEAEVKAFCEVNFNLNFPMTAITPVTGPDAHPFYAWAAAQAGAPTWNFNKYLIAPDGRLVARFGSGVRPMSLSGEIEGMLSGA